LCGLVLATVAACGAPSDPLTKAQLKSDRAADAFVREDFEEAEELFRAAIDLRERTLGESHISMATDLNGLGQTLEALDRYSEAEACYKQSVELCRRAGSEHSLTMTDGLVLLGRYNLVLDLYHRAEPPLREAVAIRSQQLDTNRIPLAEALRYLGDVLLAQERFAATDSAYRWALTIIASDSSGRAAAADVAAVLLGLGQALTELGNAAAALPLVEQGLELLRAQDDTPIGAIAHAESHLGRTLSRLERFDEAQSLLLRAYATLEETRGRESASAKQCAERLALLYTDWDKPDLVTHYLKLAGIRR
jgi:tetratricopeptide (TPR) repeat protein